MGTERRDFIHDELVRATVEKDIFLSKTGWSFDRLFNFVFGFYLHGWLRLIGIELLGGAVSHSSVRYVHLGLVR